ALEIIVDKRHQYSVAFGAASLILEDFFRLPVRMHKNTEETNNFVDSTEEVDQQVNVVSMHEPVPLTDATSGNQ
ncbi:MAG: hypothetical protein WCW35_15040, partial [Bacteroidota bacterium]